nr:PREDICTED: CST complex subunit STN1 isoform X1 [Lepisosteus oculatus]XP_015202898.1 PREDICTED: CST complex subunit STN1 isoform X1 [Lepisosteus oculatus]
MQREKGSSEEEPPSLLWGLDPIFSTFARLYIKDILQMKESCQVPGIFFYCSHPICKVDVLGTVVYKREREDFFCYGVDDGTGVINCLCWKDEQWKEDSEALKSVAKPQGPTLSGFNLAEQFQKLQLAQRRSSYLEIGDLLRVRGPVKTSRQQREISASAYCKRKLYLDILDKVEDPVLAVQISRMMEVPQLYRRFYDKPFQVPHGLQERSSDCDLEGVTSLPSLLGQVCLSLKDFLRKEAVQSFHPNDLETVNSLVSLASHDLQNGPDQQQAARSLSTSKQIHSVFREAIQVLQEEGLLFRKAGSQEEVYQVTEQDKELHRVTKEIICEDSRREKYAEKGCHFLHILSCVRQSYSRNISEAAMRLVLSALECNSDIISTTDSHYTAL